MNDHASRIRNLRRAVLLRLFNFLYRLGRWVYDPLTRVFFGKEWHRWRQTVLPWVGGGITLEIGCGTGELLGELETRSDFVVGIDLSESMLAPARRRANRSRISLVRASGTQLPFRTGTFQTVVSTFPASYIARQQTLDEIARVLLPGGYFLVVASARFTRFQWKRPFIHPVLRLAYGSPRSMNRWPADFLMHPAFNGSWQDIPTRQGMAFVWVARRRDDKPDDRKSHRAAGAPS